MKEWFTEKFGTGSGSSFVPEESNLDELDRLQPYLCDIICISSSKCGVHATYSAQHAYVEVPEFSFARPDPAHNSCKEAHTTYLAASLH